VAGFPPPYQAATVGGKLEDGAEVIDPADKARRARGLERFLMFSDGVAASAVTLLVLPLVDAVTAFDHDRVSLATIFKVMRWEVFSFALSFVGNVALWLAH
jgi:uncharacterized membrane protein